MTTAYNAHGKQGTQCKEKSAAEENKMHNRNSANCIVLGFRILCVLGDIIRISCHVILLCRDGVIIWG